MENIKQDGSVAITRIQHGDDNCYLLVTEGGCVLVDTLRIDYVDDVLKACEGKNVDYIILTHGHFDHCQNAAKLSEAFNAPIAMCKKDKDLLADNMTQKLYADSPEGEGFLQMAEGMFAKEKIPAFEPKFWLEDGETLERFGISGKVIGIPGHTDGSVAFDIEGKSLIVGDSLINVGAPRTALIFHNAADVAESAKKIAALGKRTILYGHGDPTDNWLA